MTVTRKHTLTVSAVLRLLLYAERATLMQRRMIIPFITLGLLLGPRAALAQGTLLWQQTLDGTATSDERGLSVAVDTQGNVLAAGRTRIRGTGRRTSRSRSSPATGPCSGSRPSTAPPTVRTLRNRWRWTPKATCSPPATPRIPAPDGLHGRKVRPRRDPALAADPQRHRQRLLTSATRWRWTPKATCSPPAAPRIPAPAADFTVAKFARDGTLLWQQTLNGTANRSDNANSVAVDTEGNVLAAGCTSNTGTGATSRSRSSPATGPCSGSRTSTAPPMVRDYGDSVAVDTEGNVLAAGLTENTRHRPRTSRSRSSPPTGPCSGSGPSTAPPTV